MTIKQSSQRGQVLVIIAGTLVALLGMVALAVDGSMIYADRAIYKVWLIIPS